MQMFRMRAIVTVGALVWGSVGSVGCAGDDNGGTTKQDASGDGTVDVAPASCDASKPCPAAKSPCMEAVCSDAGVCVEQPRKDGTPCSSDDPCVAKATCGGGLCIGVSSCDCKVDADCAPKEDGDACNGTLFCDLSGANPGCKVKPSTIVKCDDSLDTTCTKTTCQPADGSCKTAAVADGTACDDGAACTNPDSCQSGVCTGASSCACQTNADCDAFDDGNVCNGTLYCDGVGTANASCKVNPVTVVNCPKEGDGVCSASQCNPATGTCAVGPLPDGAACDIDGSTCSLDTCKDGACASGPLADPCACEVDADCAPFDDGNACNGTLYCSKAVGHCVLNAASIVHCPSSTDTACLRNVCTPATGLCEFTPEPDGSPCDDGWDCSNNESCSQGQCIPSKGECTCQSTTDCDAYASSNACAKLYCDKPSGICKPNPATFKLCDPLGDPACSVTVCDTKTGKCQLKPINEGGPCEADGSWCTSLDVCSKGSCKAAASQCPCKGDGDCVKFDDGDLCNGTLYCDKPSGQCLPNPVSVKTCSGDGDGPCKPLQCDPKDGACKAVALPDGATCDTDGTPCTAQACKGGSCTKLGAGCPCWENADCSVAEDGNLCNGTLFCNKAANPPICELNPASVVTCPDGASGCTVNTCDPASGSCKEAPGNEGKVCNDGDACTKADACKGGACAGTKLDPAKDCDDSNPCTNDICSASSGCQHPPQANVPCDDGSACTKQDTCDGKGACVGVPLDPTKDCSDDNACTNDTCDTAKGCVHTATQGGICNDGSACTIDDVCGTGAICAGKALVCDDGNPCTADACDPAKGCTKTPQSGSCSDSNACTSNDACNNGACVGGPAVTCDDGNPCTNDSCDPAKGCQTTPEVNGKICDDGDACTVNEACTGGACKGGVAKVCADADTCTTDSCDPKLGCKYVSDVGTVCPGGVCGALTCEPNASAPTVAIGADVGIVMQPGQAIGWGRKVNGLLPSSVLLNEGPHAPTKLTMAPTKVVAVSDFRACGLDGAGALTCWGLDDTGKAYDPTAQTSAPAMVTVAARATSMMFIDTAGAIWAMTDAKKNTLTKLVASTKAGTKFKQLAPGVGFACALRSDGVVQCWGSNSTGALGQGLGSGSLTVPPTAPVTVNVTAVEVCAGDAFACARTATGVVQCWGSNASGQIGTGSNAPTAWSPETVVGTNQAAPAGIPATSLVCGAAHACVTTATGVSCWGANDLGQLGDGGTIPRSAPVPVVHTTGVKVSSTGAKLVAGVGTTCMVVGSTLHCWGDDSHGLLGQWVANSSSDPRVPAAVLGVDGKPLLGVEALRGRDGLFCAMTSYDPQGIGSQQQWSCWGRVGPGIVPAGPLTEQTLQVATPQPGFAGQMQAELGRLESCTAPGESVPVATSPVGAAAAELSVKCMGANANGATFGVVGPPVTSLTALPDGKTAYFVRRSSTHACFSSDGGIECWGDGTKGALGDGNFAVSKSVTAAKLGVADSLRVADHLTCALTTTYIPEFALKLYCWGDNSQGRVGSGSIGGNVGLPSPVGGKANFDAFDVSSTHVCAVASGNVWCWGHNGVSSNVLGAGSSATASATPLKVTGFGGTGEPFAVSVVVGPNNSCALTDAGEVFCWGGNDAGQLGLGHADLVAANKQPVKPTQLPLASEVILNAGVGCALIQAQDPKNSAVWCWGDRSGGGVGRNVGFRPAAIGRPIPNSGT